MAEVIDSLAIEIVADDRFTKIAEGVLKTVDKLEKGTAKNNKEVNANTKQTKENTKAQEKLEAQQKRNAKAAENLIDAISGFTKALGVLGGMILAGTGFDRLVKDMAAANLELENTSKNLGMSSQSLSAWRGVAKATGGTAEGMTGYLNSLSGSLTRLAMQGDVSILPFFEALGISVLDGAGKARNLEAIMLDLSDKFSQMDRGQAYSLASQMGIDDDTFNTLVQGRKALEELLSKQAQVYKSNEQDLETSRKLTASVSMLNQQFDGLKLMIANAAMPALLKISGLTEKWFDYLNQNENLVKGVVLGIAGAIGTVLLPVLLKGAMAGTAFIAPFLPAILIVAALGTAFGLLYDDYKTWAEGGNSLFNWGVLIKWFDKANFSVENFMDGIADLIGGYKDWSDLAADAGSWLKLKGFIKDGRISVDSLSDGFKNLGKDIVEYLMPVFDRLLGVLLKIIRLDFEGAWDDTKKLGSDAVDWTLDTAKEAWNDLSNWWDGVEERTPGAIDKIAGINKDSPYSISSNLKNGNIINRSTLTDTQELFARAVSHGEGNYNSVNRGLVNGKNLGSYEEDLSKITINEILSRNKLSINDPRRMNAVGRYQIINSTLQEQIKKLGLSGNELFTPEMQDKLFLSLIPNTAKSYMDGKHNDKNSALTSLAKVWASIGVPVAMQGHKRWVEAGESYYAGDGGNKSNKDSIRLVSLALDSSRRVRIGDAPISSNALSNVQSMQSVAQSQNITNTPKAEVVVNGGIHVQSSASTISGTVSDATDAIASRAGTMLFNYGVQ